MDWKATFSVRLSCGDGMGSSAHFCTFAERFPADTQEQALDIGVKLEHQYNRFSRGVVRCCFQALAKVTVPEEVEEVLPKSVVIDARLRSYASAEKS